MRKTFTLLFILLAVKSYAQKEFDKWYFGNNNGISFVSGSPVNFTGGALNTLEGSAVISDSAGNTLFYSDGTRVYNANNVIMPNGNGLLGGSSSTQSALVVPSLSNSKQYYLFTVDQFLGANGFRYSIVDMSLQGGLGDVTGVKNVQLLGVCDEKLTAVKQSGCGGYWVLVHANSAISNAYYAYPLTSSGIGPPVISNVGPLFNSANSYIGYMKVSPDGKHIARTIYSSGQAEIADFDAATGVVSNPFTFSAVVSDKIYGVEFSASGNVLYIMSGDAPPTKLWQLNMQAGNAAAILSSRVLVDSTPGERGMSLLRARDNKIYASHPTVSFLGVINNPEVLGMGCNYVRHGFALSSAAQIGLPNFICGSLATSGGLVSNFTSSDTVICSEGGGCFDFTDHSTCNPTSWKWLFPGAIPDSSTQQNPTSICYFNSGTYAVTLIVSKGTTTDTLSVAPMIIVGQTPPTPTISLVGWDTLVSTHASAYQWFFNGVPISGATDSFYVAVNDGAYNVYITDSLGCSSLGNSFLFVGINSMSNEQGIGIYPNPAKGQFTVYGLQFTVNHPSLDIYSMLGERVYSLKPETVNGKPETVIDVSTLAKGVYILQIRTDRGEMMVTRKLMVE